LNPQNEYDLFTFRDLMDSLPPLETVKAETPIREAIRKMCARDYSQLPVIKDKNCVGSVTSDSILRRLRNAEKKGYRIEMDWPVERFLDQNPPRFVRSDNDLMGHVNWMASNGFVLIGSPQKVEAIVTNYDLVLFFKEKTEAFLLLREIETTIRYLIRQTLSDQELKEALASIKKDDGSTTGNLTDLTFDNLRQLILANWTKFENLFKDKEKTNKQLQIVRNMRNEIFHFRRPIEESRLQQLRRLRDNYAKMAKNLK
jgi:predicted transcriptional regulator